MREHIFAFFVPGRPIPQGSMAAITIGGKARIVHSKRKSKTGKPRESVQSWRKRAAHAAREAMEGEPFDGPVRVSAVFALDKPKSRRKRDEYPDRKPDLDKLARALGDALEGVVVTQDSRIVEWRVRKRWSGEDMAEGVRVMVIATEGAA